MMRVLIILIIIQNLFAIAIPVAMAENNRGSAMQFATQQDDLNSLTQGGVKVTITWVYADAARITVAYTIIGLTPPSGYTWFGCVVRSATLTDGSARQFGKNGTRIQCEQQESGDFHVTQSFYQDLSASRTGTLPLQLTMYVGGTQIMPVQAKDEGNSEGSIATAPDAGIFTFDLVTSLSKGLTLRPRLNAQVNGVTATLREVQINPTFVESDICIALPSLADWHPEAVVVTQQGRQASAGWEVINFKQSKAWASKQRCYRFTFPTISDVTMAQTLQIEIERLRTGLPEVLSEEACLAAKEKRRNSQTEVDFECRAVDYGYWFDVTQIPEGMSSDEAYRQVTWLFSDVIEGPWVFSIETQVSNR